MRVISDLTLPKPPPARSGRSRASGDEAKQIGQVLWEDLSRDVTSQQTSEAMIRTLQTNFDKALRRLPRRKSPVIRQPYLHARTIRAFEYLRDWRSQIRVLRQQIQLTVLKAALDAWRSRPVNIHRELYTQRIRGLCSARTCTPTPGP